ncbi:MAG: Type 1 glutamine amidotransferase-like domain-containing protein [Candidatus Gracilibacteria bacterium]|nr:Type 1 glutamine amidotransferase-like domain-containing protein [Candidatus Gracilibacteria bacterium]
MKLYLGGGWNPEGGTEALRKAHSCVEEIFRKERTKQVLHIPFARTGIMKKNRNSFGPQEFGPYIENLGVEYLNAMYFEDIEKFDGDTIYINGGNDCEFLMQMCKNEKLLQAISGAKIIIGESCGSMIMGEYFLNNTRSEYIKGLGYVVNTIIEPHFSQKNKTGRLRNGMNVNDVKVGLGIDENTFIKYENGTYGEVVGFGNVVHL